jgi:D-arabinose 1-dehydrogenase-like Zn-dependent alcohol dehydrogenase
MRSYQIVEWGQPIELREYPTPSPQGTEVLLRVTAAGICHSDLHINDGFFDLGEGKRVELARLGAALPLTLGHEIVGVVEALGPDAEGIATGPGAEGVAVGDARVAFPWIGCRQCRVCAREPEHYCLSPKFLGARTHGGYAEYVLVPHPKYLLAYDGIPTELACTYACAGLTAYSALKKLMPLEDDEYLVTIGAGGVGLSGVHIAPALTDAKLVVADIDPEKRAVARQAGAHETVDNKDPDAVARVKELSGGGVKAAIDFVGAPTTAQFGLDVLRKGGTLVMVGLYGGALSFPLPFFPQRALAIRGSYVGTLDELRELIALGQDGKIPPIPLDLRPLDAAPAAMANLRAGHVRGRVILKPDA